MEKEVEKLEKANQSHDEEKVNKKTTFGDKVLKNGMC